MTSIHSDPYVPDCSSHEVPDIRDPDSITRIRIGEFGSSDEKLDRKAGSHKQKEDCPDPTRNPKSPYKGVHQTKTGRWTSLIGDPYTHIPLYVATFATAEEAYEAYCAAKLELDQKAASRKSQKAAFIQEAASASSKRHRTEPKFYHLELNKSPQKKSLGLETPYKGVRKRPSGKFDANIWNPTSKTKCYLGLFGSAEAAHAAYCAKKLKINKKFLKNGNSYKQVEQMKSGFWVSRILDPTEGLIRLGKFRSEEEALRAHHTKKLEIEEKGKVKRGKGPNENPYRGSKRPNPEGRGFGSATCLLQPKSGRLIFQSAEVTYEAYSAMKREIELKKAASVEVEQEMGKTRDGSGSPYNGVVEKTLTYDCSKKLEIEGEADREEEKPQEAASVRSPCSQPFSGTSKDIEEKADSVPLIVDENGFLLGEFSQIDDLAICEADDCY